MQIVDLAFERRGGHSRSSARVIWDELNEPASTLAFTVPCGPNGPLEPSPEAFLLACFPLAAMHGERRIAVDAPICPRLTEGLHTVHSWWRTWRLVEAAMPRIEAKGRPRRASGPASAGPSRSLGFLSGGVDSAHMLLRNRTLYERGDPAYIEDALVIHGFDIGKRKQRPEDEHFAMAMAHLAPLAAAMDVRLLACTTNARHLPTRPGAWSTLHHGAVLAAVAHAATRDSAQVFVAATFDVAHMVPWGSHPLVDPHYSSQRATLIHEGSRFSRLTKVRELARSPAHIANLRVCPANVAGRLNCGACEKCLRTRLELLAAGIDENPAFGATSMSPEQLASTLAIESEHQTSYYEEVLAALQARGLDDLARVVAGRLADLRGRQRETGEQARRNAWAA